MPTTKTTQTALGRNVPSTKRRKKAKSNRKGAVPVAVRKALGLNLTGPLPKAVKYAHAMKSAEDVFAVNLPVIAERMVALALDGDMDAMKYSLDRILGRPSLQELAPAADRTLPEELRTTEGVEGMLASSLFATASPACLERVKLAILDDLKQRGEVADGGEVTLQGEAGVGVTSQGANEKDGVPVSETGLPPTAEPPSSPVDDPLKS